MLPWEEGEKLKLEISDLVQKMYQQFVLLQEQLCAYRRHGTTGQYHTSSSFHDLLEMIARIKELIFQQDNLFARITGERQCQTPIWIVLSEQID